MSHEDYKLFESVIHITEERDKRSLGKSLIKTLSEFIEFDSLILLRVPRGEDNEYVEVATSIPGDVIQAKLNLIPHEYGNERVERDDSITLCINNGEIISDKHNNSPRMLYPVLVNNAVTHILAIYGHNNTSNTSKLILGFIRIYSNFLAILTDSERDALTGLLNRKTFDEQLTELVSEFVQENSTVSSKEIERRTVKKDIDHWIGLLDIDHFKNINDNFGHMYGDEVLILFSNIMEEAFRSSDLLFRYGGEEFVVVLPNVTKTDAFKSYERFRKNVELHNFPQVGRVTVSIGLAKIHAQEHPREVLQHADRALYYVKEHGRNQVCSYHELIKTGLLKEQQIESNIHIF